MSLLTPLRIYFFYSVSIFSVPAPCQHIDGCWEYDSETDGHRQGQCPAVAASLNLDFSSVKWE